MGVGKGNYWEQKGMTPAVPGALSRCGNCLLFIHGCAQHMSRANKACLVLLLNVKNETMFIG